MTTSFQKYKTPHIVISKGQIEAHIESFCACLQFKPQQLFYPVKVNSNPAVIELMKFRGINFEVGAISECKLLLDQGIAPNRIRYGNPVKSAESIQEAHRMGIPFFGADSAEELEKIAKYAPQSSVYIRVAVDNSGAEWALTHKFGCKTNAVDSLFELGKKLSLTMFGLSFHVGWNNEHLETWHRVCRDISELAIQLKQKHSSFNSVNIGGGFPAHHGNQTEKLHHISEVILPYLLKWKNEEKLEVVAEPGSYLLANAGTMVVKVIARIVRNNVDWVYVDSGIFQGFSWIMGGLSYKIEALSPKDDEITKKMVVCGPTCDTHDVFSHSVILPDSISEGDLLLVSPAGAYISSSKSYNGFDFPEEVVVE
jgi:ornithine decarboxylase